MDLYSSLTPVPFIVVIYYRFLIFYSVFWCGGFLRSSSEAVPPPGVNSLGRYPWNGEEFVSGLACSCPPISNSGYMLDGPLSTFPPPSGKAF